MSLQRECTFILALLLILAGASWAVLIWQSSMMKSMGMGLDPLWHSRDRRARYTLAKPRSYVVEKTSTCFFRGGPRATDSGAVAPPGPRLCKKLTLTRLVGVSITFFLRR